MGLKADEKCFLDAATFGKIQILKYLDQINPDFKNFRDAYNNTALTLAARYADKQTVQFLIENLKMDVTQPGFAGRTCYHQAANNDVNAVEILGYLESKFPLLKTVKDDSGDTPFQFFNHFVANETFSEP